jgi:hypothetical protein
MGLFSKDKPKSDGPALAPTEDEQTVHPITHIATLIAQTPNPITSLAMVITLLLRHGWVTTESLATLGLSTDELTVMVQAVDGFEDVESFIYEMQVQTALRAYDRTLEIIAAERGIPKDGDTYVNLRSVLARFASENEITDLRVAYRLMLAERPNDLPSNRS